MECVLIMNNVNSKFMSILSYTYICRQCHLEIKENDKKLSKGCNWIVFDGYSNVVVFFFMNIVKGSSNSPLLAINLHVTSSVGS